MTEDRRSAWRRWWMIVVSIVVGVSIVLVLQTEERQVEESAEVDAPTLVVYNRPNEGFRISLPGDWTLINGSESFETLHSIGLSEEAIGEIRELEATGTYPIQAVGSQGDFMTQVQAAPVSLVPVGFESFELGMQFFASEIDGEASVVATETVTVDGVQGFHGVIDIENGSRSGRMHAHYFVLGGSQYGVYMVGDGDTEYLDELFDTIISTLEFTHDEV